MSARICPACGDTEVTRFFVHVEPRDPRYAGYVVRVCRHCENRRGGYYVKNVPTWHHRQVIEGSRG